MISLIIVIPAAALLLWRLWRFTIRPLLHPEEPKELPYWIPYIGHAWSFFQDYNEALENGRKYFHDCKEPYSIWMAGKQIYIVTAPDDVAKVYSNTNAVSYHNILVDMYRQAGVSETTISKMFTPHPSAPQNSNSQSHFPNYMLTNFMRLQVQPGEKLDDLFQNNITPSISAGLDLDRASHPAVLDRGENGVTVSLLKLCAHMFLRGSLDAVFGKGIWSVDSNLVDSLDQWDRVSWKFMFHMPAFMSRDMITSKSNIVTSFRDYFRIPAEQRKDCSFFVRATVEMLRGVDCPDEDMGRIFLLWTWAIVANVHKIAFWVISYLAYDPNLVDAIRAEVLLAMQDDQVEKAKILDVCPQLDSLINEVLRLTVASALAREIESPFELGGKILQPGNALLVPFRQLHLNSDVWGPDPTRMEPDRFVKSPKLQNSKSYRPFGGGNTLCPGRHFSKIAIAYAVAEMVSQFDIGVKKEKDGSLPQFPRIDSTKPSPGASSAFDGEDVFLVMEKKVGK